MKKDNIENAIILVDKPAGKTSFETVTCVKKILGINKIGHSGTLDKFASGLLVLCTGKVTKLTRYFLESDKRYIGNVKLGIKTDTCDVNGKVIEVKPTDKITNKDIEFAVNKFKGEILQKPPIFSALKINGKRASDLVRKGEVVNLKQRKVTIHKIDIIDVDLNNASFSIDVFCSKGTYIRSLVRDIGDLIGVGAYLEGLKRITSGYFDIKNAANLNEIKEFADSGRKNKKFVLEPKNALKEFSKIVINNKAKKRVINGAYFERDEVLKYIENNKKLITVLDEKKNLIAIADIDFKKWKIKYLNVFN